MKVKTLIVGLGNPGKKYEKTRHNAGFMVLDALSSEFRTEKKFDAEISGLGDGVVLMKPQTFMNLSGKAVRSFVDYYKLPAEKVWVIHDDVDIPFGEAKIRENGSSAGHKGIESIISSLGTTDFWRFRIGVKNEDLDTIETEDFVLQKFKNEEERDLQKLIKACSNEIENSLKEGLEAKTIKTE